MTAPGCCGFFLHPVGSPGVHAGPWLSVFAPCRSVTVRAVRVVWPGGASWSGPVDVDTSLVCACSISGYQVLQILTVTPHCPSS